MVSTRSSSTRADSASPPSPPPSVRPKRSSKPPSSSSSSRRTARGPPAAAAAVSAASASSRWSHTPTAVTLAWMAVSLPLVVWDTGYVLGRPHTMEGGSLHWPLWAPYKLYGEVDYMYGWRAYQARNGFTAAQGLVNVVETLMYLFYLWAWWTAARGRAAEARRRRRLGAFAALVGFSAAVMTLSKTLLYWLNEYYSFFDNIGHNTPFNLIALWIVPNGAWLVGSAYMIWAIGTDIVNGLASAAPPHVKAE